MNAYEQLIAQLESESVVEKRDAFAQIQMLANPWIVQPSLIDLVLAAEEKHIEWVLEGYDYEQGEGQEHGFNLLEATIHYDWWCVSAVTQLLIEFDTSSIDVLLPLLKHEKAILRAWSVFVLGEIGDESVVPHLLDRLKAFDQRELWRVCEALGKLRAAEAVPRLIELLEDEGMDVDSTAATALGQIGDPRALSPLIEQFKKHKPSVYAVTAALYQFGDQAVLPLVEVLFDDHAKRVHDLVLINLGTLNDQRAIDPILRYLESVQDNVSKRAAITALGRLKAKQAVPRIAELFQTATDFDIRLSSSMALAAIGNQLAFETLVHELVHGTPERQHHAALAFGQMEHVEVIEPLLNALKNGSSGIRSAVAVSLGNLRDRRAIPALKEALSDTDEHTRHYAQVGLDKINAVDRNEANSAAE